MLRWREGEGVTIRVTNRLDEPTSIYWHGIILPANMDGVPGISFDAVAPGMTFTYRFPVKQSSTYWYHSHSELQEQAGMYAPIIIEPAQREPYRYDHEYVVMLSDWIDEDPPTVFANIADVTGCTYTFLINGQPPGANWTALFKLGERVRLRFVNGSAMTYFDVRIPGLSMTVVQADGQDVQPVTADEFRIAVAETYDVIVEPKENRAYTPNKPPALPGVI